MSQITDDEIHVILNTCKHILEGKPINLVINFDNQKNKLTKIMASLKKLEDAVTKETGLVDSAITLIQGIAEKLREANGDEKKIEQLAKQLEDKSEALATAIAANTPAEGGGETPAPGDSGTGGTTGGDGGTGTVGGGTTDVDPTTGDTGTGTGPVVGPDTSPIGTTPSDPGTTTDSPAIGDTPLRGAR